MHIKQDIFQRKFYSLLIAYSCMRPRIRMDINKMQIINKELEIQNLIEKLYGKDIHVREQARYLLVNKGRDATDYLLSLLQSKNSNQRLEAVKLLGRIKDPSSASALVEMLVDESIGVDWAASNALIALGGNALLPLLNGLVKYYDSARFRQSAMHILHTFEQSGILEHHVQEVLDALRGVEPSASVPWAAERAFEAISIHT